MGSETRSFPDWNCRYFFGEKGERGSIQSKRQSACYPFILPRYKEKVEDTLPDSLRFNTNKNFCSENRTRSHKYIQVIELHGVRGARPGPARYRTSCFSKPGRGFPGRPNVPLLLLPRDRGR